MYTMSTKQLLNLDCRKEENQKIIQKVLRQIKPLSRYSDEENIPFSALEKAITIMCKKYCMRIAELTPDVLANDKHIIWKAKLINETNSKTIDNVIDNVYGVSLYEVLAKSAIRLYAEVKKGIKIRS